jgi:hypothetical protein
MHPLLRACGVSAFSRRKFRAVATLPRLGRHGLKSPRPAVITSARLLWEFGMHRRQALKLLAGFSVCPLCSRAGFAADPHWSYEGTGGAANWGDLDPSNRACAAGLQQSPLHIGDVIRAQLSPLRTIWDKRADDRQ